MFKKFICFLTCISVIFLCLPVFSFASEQQVTQYAGIPRPVPSNNVKYIVTQNRERTESYLYMISIPGIILEDFVFQASPDGWYDLNIYLFAVYDFNFTVNILKFDLNGDFLESFSVTVENGDILNSVVLLSFNASEVVYVDLFDIPVNDLNGMYSWGTPSVAWNDSIDPEVYTSWLNSINNMLNEIDNNTDNVESQLSDISSELSLFYSVFNSYQSQMLGNTATIISSLNTLNSRLNSFAQQNHYDLEQIYLMLSQIYALLSEEQQTRPPAIENESEVQNVLQNEAALNKDFSGDLNQQFDVAGNIFESNSAFSFISNLFQELVLDVPALNSLVIFSLAIGLCVLILGRRLNA